MMRNLWQVVITAHVVSFSFGQQHSENGLEIVEQFDHLGNKLRSLIHIQDDNFHRLVIQKLESVEKVIDSYQEYILAQMTDKEQENNQRSEFGMNEQNEDLSEGAMTEDIPYSRTKRQVDFAALGFDLESTCNNETKPVFYKLLQVEQGIKNNSKNIDKIVSLDLKDLADGNKLNKDNIEDINENVKYIRQTVDLLLNLGLYQIETCADLKTYGDSKSGIYRLGGKTVYCDQDTDGGGWLVFQRRMDGSEDFYRTWEEYKEGFGDLNGEFWLGNEYLSKMTDLATRGWQELRIDMIADDGEKYYAKYGSFRVMSEIDDYRLFAFSYRGNAGNGLYKDTGKYFCTKDRDNDKSMTINCAIQYKGGWWYSDCYSANMNGIYHSEGADTTARDGIVWSRSRLETLTLKYVEMKFRTNRL